MLMTPTAVEALDAAADDLGLTRSEVNERLIRGDAEARQAVAAALAKLQAARQQEQSEG